MPRRKPAKLNPITRNDARTGDDYLRQWIAFIGNATHAEEAANLCRGHLRVWIYDPNRGFSSEVALKLARASGAPVEALMYRYTPIRDLDFWRFVKAA
jgi:hypothetical protein